MPVRVRERVIVRALVILFVCLCLASVREPARKAIYFSSPACSISISAFLPSALRIRTEGRGRRAEGVGREGGHDWPEVENPYSKQICSYMSSSHSR